MRIIDKCILFRNNIGIFGSLYNPESLIEKIENQREEKSLRPFSDKEIIKLADFGYPIERGRTIQ